VLTWVQLAPRVPFTATVSLPSPVVRMNRSSRSKDFPPATPFVVVTAIVSSPAVVVTAPVRALTISIRSVTVPRI
jgi:hypothetical protein